MVNGEEKFPGFFYKKRILFPFGKDLHSTRQNFEYKCASGSGAHDALKHVQCAGRVEILVSRNQKLETMSVFPKKKNIRPPGTTKILSAFCSSEYSSSNALKILLVAGGRHLEKKRSKMTPPGSQTLFSMSANSEYLDQGPHPF